VIDDEINSTESRRRTDYIRVLSVLFDLEFVENSKDLFERVNLNRYDAYVLDYDLSSWKYRGKVLKFDDVLQKLPFKKPVVLVSNHFDKLVSNQKLSETMQTFLESDKELIHLLEWSVFQRQQDGSIVDNSDFYESVSSMINLSLKSYYLKNEVVDIAIICAVKSEHAAIYKELDLVSRRTINSCSVTIGEREVNRNGTKSKIKIALALQPEMGVVSSSYLSSFIIENLSPKFLCMIGVCCGREKEGLKIGDLILFKESITYDTGKVEEEVFIPDTQESSSTPSITNMLNGIDFSDDLKKIRDELENEFKVSSIPNFKVGSMGCGGVVINTDKMVDQIAERVAKRKLLGVEMEAYGVLKSRDYFDNLTKVFVLKSVMDLCSNKDDSKKAYASAVASKFTLNLIDKYLNYSRTL